MDYFNDVLTTFLGLEHGSCVAVYGGSYLEYILICVPKMNKGLMSLVLREGRSN